MHNNNNKYNHTADQLIDIQTTDTGVTVGMFHDETDNYYYALAQKNSEGEHVKELKYYQSRRYERVNEAYLDFLRQYGGESSENSEGSEG